MHPTHLTDPAIASGSADASGSAADARPPAGSDATPVAATSAPSSSAPSSRAPGAEPGQPPPFVHLRLRSEFSISDSIVRIDDAVAAAAADGQVALALADAGNLFGWVRFYKAARAAGVQPICAVDTCVSNAVDRDKPDRLLLIATDAPAYRRLCELVSRSWLENEHRGRGEMDPSWFTPEAVRGLIALSGAAHGAVGKALAAGDRDGADRAARWLAERFEDAFYLEVQRTGAPESERLTRRTAWLASRLALPLLATHPIQFLGRDEYRAHEARVCIAEGEILGNPRRQRRYTEEQYFLSRAQMAERFADLPAALANTVAVARRCSLTLELGKSKLPAFPTEAGESVDAAMRRLATRGLAIRMEKSFPDPAARAARQGEYEQRLATECDTIVAMGFAGYFLIVADFIGWAKANDVPVGPGRGSGAGSLVAFALGITDLDPLPYALLFERFLNPERVSMPDFDIDFCQDKRGLVIEYVRGKYGGDAVAQIATFGTMASKAVIRDVGRVLDMSYTFCDQLSKLIPVVQAKPLSLAKAIDAEPQLAERVRNEEEVRELIALAKPLEDLTRNVGMHAGGVLIAPGRLTDFCPLYKAPGTDSVISQFDKDDVEAVGLVKFDFLGLRNLTIIDLAVRYVNRRRAQAGESPLDLALLAFDDPAAYQVLKDGNTVAIFQVESDGMKKLLRKLQPDRFEDVIAVLALYRPGPLGSGMVDDFILRKRGQQRIDYFHPDLKECLEPTYGVIVYQEQVMQIAQIIAGYTLGGADLLRRAMGKKKASEMAEQRQTFVDGAGRRGHTPALATQLFDLMEKFAEYGFNKSHTAAYAVVTYQTAWLKAHHPAEFLAATLSSDMDDTDKVQLFVRDARDNGVSVELPDINNSAFRFEPRDDRHISYGLGAIKGAGEAAVMNIVAAREAGGPFTDLFEFCERIDRRLVSKRSIEGLVRAGAFDRLDDDRARLLANVGRAFEAAERNARSAAAGQTALFGDVGGAAMPPAAREWIAAPRWDEARRLLEEKAALGFYLSGHVFTPHEAELRRFVRTRLSDLPKLVETERGAITCTVAGVIVSIQSTMTRRGRMMRVMLDDKTATQELCVFAEQYEQNRSLLKEDGLVVVHARLSRDEYSGGFRFSAERLVDLETARGEHARLLRLRMNGESDAKRLAGLLGSFRRDRAGLPVEIEYLNGSATVSIRLGPDWAVKPEDALLAQLKDWLSADGVLLDYR
jgi:DNA polymerase-3 subunit alpha